MALDPGACSFSHMIIYPQHLQRVGEGEPLALRVYQFCPAQHKLFLRRDWGMETWLGNTSQGEHAVLF